MKSHFGFQLDRPGLWGNRVEPVVAEDQEAGREHEAEEEAAKLTILHASRSFGLNPHVTAVGHDLDPAVQVGAK
jgi:hypothetical protein